MKTLSLVSNYEDMYNCFDEDISVAHAQIDRSSSGGKWLNVWLNVVCPRNKRAKVIRIMCNMHGWCCSEETCVGRKAIITFEYRKFLNLDFNLVYDCISKSFSYERN